ncbi:putative lactate 2-monooxygenase [Lachnellula willkommii]|uniref:Putative lactate 2-monooxygenase n=1 Tax=Lachnellula willkommii TaxID=215461 RepID=A0A559MFM8_9HELO|nr:putative lactate 2-monooxygenase [Lachnellula willkommii]
MSSTTDKQIPQSVQASNDKQRKYGAFQNEVYRAGMFHNRLPVVTTDPNKLEEQAKSILKPTAFNYVAGGAGERATMDANRLAFRQWKLVPRMLRATSQRDLSVELFGETYETPVLMAPVGVQSIFHEDKETGLSEVCASIGIPYILSTASTSSIEEVAQASGTGPRWFQLYWPQTDAYTISLLNRAKANGFKVLVVTLDTWALAWRPADLDHAYVPFFKGIGNKIGWGDPVFRAQFRAKYGVAPEENIVLASQEWIGDVFSGAAHSWEDIALLKRHWDGPIVLKGIQVCLRCGKLNEIWHRVDVFKHPDDARLAVEYGVDGIIVSNHGGRQLDGAVASLEMLPEIVEAVGDKLTVLFDSGIRTGVDIIKALSLGAKAVLVGRPAIYGLAVGGKQGAKQVLQGILADLDQSMGISGIKDVGGCDMSMVRRCEYGGDVKSSN